MHSAEENIQLGICSVCTGHVLDVAGRNVEYIWTTQQVASQSSGRKLSEVSPKMPIKALRNWPLCLYASVWDTDVPFKTKTWTCALKQGVRPYCSHSGNVCMNALSPWSFCASLGPAAACSWWLRFYHRSQTDSWGPGPPPAPLTCRSPHL